MGKKRKMIAELRAKTGMGHAESKRIVEERATHYASREPDEAWVNAAGIGAAGLMHARGNAEEPEGVEATLLNLIALAQARHDAKRAHGAEHMQRGRVSVTAADILAERRARGWRRPPEDQALRDALMALPLEVLRKIEAIMYAGRGDDGILDLFVQLPEDDRQATVGQIASKMPLAEYLRLGLLEAKRIGLGLDDDWTELMAAARGDLRRNP